MGHEPTTPEVTIPARRRLGPAALPVLAVCIVAFEVSQLACLLAAAGGHVDTFDLVASRDAGAGVSAIATAADGTPAPSLT